MQTWYPHPKQMAAETDLFTMTGLAKAIIVAVGGQRAARQEPAPGEH